MIWYNVTIKIEEKINDDWLAWMQHIHIPEVLDTGYFTEGRLSRLINSQEKDGITYSVQYACKNMKDLHHYQVDHAQRLQKEHNARYEGKYVAFRSLMEELYRKETL